MEWEERRGSSRGVGLALRAGEDNGSAKSRRDESSRARDESARNAGRAATSGRSALTLVGVAGAVVVIAVAGVVAAMAIGGDEDSQPTATSGGSPDPGAADDDGPSTAGGGDGTETVPVDEEATASGTTTGKVTVTFTKKGIGSETRSGGLVFELDCSTGSTCTASGFTGSGDLASFNSDFLGNYMDLAWEGGAGAWSHQGRAPANCDEPTADDHRALATGTLAVDGDVVTLTSSTSEYDLNEDKRVCNGPETVLSFTGSLS